MNSFSFIIPGKPQGKGRPRFAGGHVFTPQATHDYERLVAACARRALSDREAEGAKPWRLEGSKRVDIRAWKATPKSWSKKERQEYHMKPCQRKPDNDNIEKIVWDGLNGIAYEDDSQITKNGTEKVWRSDLGDTEYPCGYVEVWVFDLESGK